MELTGSNEESGKNKIKILLEVNAKNEKNDFFIINAGWNCMYTNKFPTNIVKINNANKNGNKLIQMENISIYYRDGISICSSVRDKYPMVRY
ncbi:unnamed protein product [Meloidogyne enterolobii]|uniref:Uncharacterized protein n=1 Tax=Meloidogyne enterolobii TaxID=390850 RepID=A0ACB0YQY3_MELEN